MVAYANQVVEADVVCDEKISAEPRVSHNFDRLIKTWITAHTARDNFFAKDNIVEVKGRGLFKHAHDDQSPAGTGKSACHQDCCRLTRTLNDDIEALAIGEVESTLGNIFARRIDYGIGAAFSCSFDSPLRHFDCDHLLHSPDTRRHERHQANWACSHDRHIVFAAGLALLHSTHSRREWLNQSTGLVRKCVGKVIALIGVQVEAFRKPATSPRCAKESYFIALSHGTAPAPATVQAADYRASGNTVPNSEAL